MKKKYIAPMCKLVCAKTEYVIAAGSSFAGGVQYSSCDVAEKDEDDDPIWHTKSNELWDDMD